MFQDLSAGSFQYCFDCYKFNFLSWFPTITRILDHISFSLAFRKNELKWLNAKLNLVGRKSLGGFGLEFPE